MRGNPGSTAAATWAKRGWAGIVVAVAISAAMTACGGGGGDSPPPPTPPTTIPDSLAISAPAGADAASAVQFGNTASALSGLKFNWDFGDGSTSTEAAPSHKYAQGGDFTVVLKVTNEAGTSKEVRTPVSVTNLATVRGLACSGPNDTGWCWQSPRPTGNAHNDVFFTSAQLGWMVGDLGEVLKTVDGGATWKRQRFDANVNWARVSFADERNGFIVGSGISGANNGLRTTDGGATWTPFQGSWSQGPVKLTMVDARTVAVQDDGGGLHVSKDAGLTWAASRPNAPVVTRNGTVWSLSAAGDRLLRSTDLGTTNAPVFTYVPPAGYRFSSMALAALDDQRVMLVVTLWDEAAAASTFDVWRTRDGGATWARPAMGGFAAAKASQLSLDTRTGGFTLGIASVNTLYRSLDVGDTWVRLDNPPNTNTYENSAEYYYGLDDGTLVFLSRGGITASPDGGASWGPLVQPDGLYGYGLRKVQVLEGKTWQLLDEGGNLWRSDDKGKTWRASVLESSAYYFGFHAFDARRALALELDCTLRETQDGGATWQARTTPWTACGTNGVRELLWRSAKLGWYNGSDGKLFRTTDGGLTWQDTASGVGVASVRFYDDNNGFAMSDGQLLSSGNAGQSWTAVGALPPQASRVRFFNAKQGVAMTASGVFATHDGGLTWRQAGTYDFGDVQFIDASTVWAVQRSGGLFKSTDGGDTWQPVGTAALIALQFIDANRGWAVGWGGQVQATTDGGKTWVPQALSTIANLRQVFFVDSKTGWIVGDGGTLLATGSGGQ